MATRRKKSVIVKSNILLTGYYTVHILSRSVGEIFSLVNKKEKHNTCIEDNHIRFNAK